MKQKTSKEEKVALVDALLSTLKSEPPVRSSERVRRWVAMHTAWSTRAEYDAGWHFVRDRQSISIFIKVQGIENAKWLARQLNKAEAPNGRDQRPGQETRELKP